MGIGDVLDESTLNSEKQESTVDEASAVADDQCEGNHQKQFVEQSCQTDEFNYLFTCSHEFTQTFEEAEFQNDDERGLYRAAMFSNCNDCFQLHLSTCR